MAILNEIMGKILREINATTWTKTDRWESIINQIPEAILESYSDNKESLFNIYQNLIDFENFEIDYFTDETYFWNESIVQIFEDIKDLEDWHKKFGKNGNDFLKYADAGNYFYEDVDDKRWVIPWRNYDQKNYNYVRGNDKFLKVLSSDDNLQFTKKKELEWIRLIMPKNTRRVEIEDLNRNFWVIGQALSQICQYLFDDNSPIKKLLPKFLSELAQLNDNVMNLWAHFYLASLKTYSDIKVIFIPLQPNKWYNGYSFPKLEEASTIKKIQPRYDRTDWSGFSKGMYSYFFGDFWRYHTYLINQYPESNLVVIPYARANNYKHNYFSRVYFPGILFYDRNQHMRDGETSCYLFLTEDGKDISIDVREDPDIEATFVLDNLYAFKEQEDTYRMVRPLSQLDQIEEDEPQKYYGAIRFVPEIETEYNKGIIVKKFVLRFYDAGEQIITSNAEPILTLSANNLVSDPTNMYYRDAILKVEKRRSENAEVIMPYDSVSQNNKLYMGEVLSWYGRTTEREKWTLGDYESYANTGILIKIGNFLPKGTLSIGSNGRQNIKYDSFGKGTHTICHQSHTISTSPLEIEKTAYEVNLSVSGGGMPGQTAGKGGYGQSNCSYYYPTFNKERGRWEMNDIGTNHPFKSDIISHGLDTIHDYLFGGKTSIEQRSYYPSSTYGQLDDKSYFRSPYDELSKDSDDTVKLDRNKATYFIGGIGIKTWDNSGQIYWSSNILFGIYVYVPKALLTEGLIQTIRNLNKEFVYRTYIEDEHGIIFYRGDINRSEKNFKIDTTSDQFFRNTGTPWRLPKIFPYEEDISGVKVTSSKTGATWYCPLTTSYMKDLYERDKNAFEQRLPEYKSKFKTQEDFYNEAMDSIINKSAGIWTVYDGNTKEDRDIATPAVMDNNIFVYNKKNTNRQVCYMTYSISHTDRGTGISRNNLLLRQRTEGKTVKWIPTQQQVGYDFNLVNYKNENVDLVYTNKFFDTNKAYNAVWDTGAKYESVQRTMEVLDIPYLQNEIQGISISSKNIIEDEDINNINTSEFDFAILRVGYSDEEHKCHIDVRFEDLYKKISPDKPVGIYWESTAETKNQITEEVKFLIDYLNGMKPEYPIFLRFNEEKISISGNQLMDVINEFITQLNNKNYFGCLYISSDFNISTGLNGDYTENLIKTRRIWYSYMDNPSRNLIDDYKSFYGMWQYSDGNLEDVYNQYGVLIRKGVPALSGFQTDVERNYCFVDLKYMVNNFSGIGSNQIKYQDWKFNEWE